MTINERICEIIKLNKKFTQKGMADSIGIASSTVNNWLKSGRAIPAEYVVPIADYLNVSYEYLLTGKNSKIAFSKDDEIWLSLIHQLPDDAQAEFRGEIKGYLKRMRIEESVAADPPLKQAK